MLACEEIVFGRQGLLLAGDQRVELGPYDGGGDVKPAFAESMLVVQIVSRSFVVLQHLKHRFQMRKRLRYETRGKASELLSQRDEEIIGIPITQEVRATSGGEEPL